MTNFVHFLFLLFVFYPLLAAESLEYVQIWFRHGERTPTKYHSFPTEALDIGKEFRIGKGELTFNGQRMEYQLGLNLKRTYGDFLGSYIPSENRIYFDEDNRTSTSALCAMAGLFPPTGEYIWDNKLLWQPVALHEQKIMAHVSTGTFDHCPKYTAELKSDSHFADLLVNANQDLIKFLSNKSGIAITDVKIMNDIADALVTRTNINDPRYPVPSWMNMELYPKMKNISFYVHTSMLDWMRPTSGVWHVTKLIEGIESHLAREVKNKADFFSGHDTNILTFCRLLGIRDCSEEMCFYGAHLSFELHKSAEGRHILKTYYSYQYNETQHQVAIPACGEPCYWDIFREQFGKNRFSDEAWWGRCNGWAPERENTPVLSGALLLTCIVLFTSSLVLLYTTCSYRRQLLRFTDPERNPLVD